MTVASAPTAVTDDNDRWKTKWLVRTVQVAPLFVGCWIIFNRYRIQDNMPPKLPYLFPEYGTHIKSFDFNSYNKHF